MADELLAVALLVLFFHLVLTGASWAFDFSRQPERQEQLMDASDTQVLIKVPNPAEAAAIVQALNDQGIQAVADGHGVVGWQVEAPAMIRVLVHASDYPRARQLLEQLREDAEDIDWDNVDVGVPEE